MPDLLVRPAAPAGEVLKVTPQSAGWEHIGLTALKLAPGERYEGVNDGVEAVLVIQGGRCDVTSSVGDFAGLGERAHAFAGLPHALYLPVGASLRVRIRARDVILALERPEGLSALNILSGTVTEVAAGEGPSLDVTLDCGGERLLARITRKSAEHLGVAPGRAVHAIVKSIAFDPQVVTRVPRGD